MKSGLYDFAPLLERFLPEEGQPVAVGVSGGPDSMALCHALAACARGPVHALSVDHGLRPESAAEAKQAGRRVKGWPHVTHTVLTRKPKAGAATKIQEQARDDRYRLLAGYCEKHGIAHLFIAHHQDDQAETLLFRLAKGSGLDGLAGMPFAQAYNDGLQIIRPFLEIPKTDLLAYCDHLEVPYADDPSNKSERYARVRLRQARAALEREGLTNKRLAVTAARLARARQALETYAEKVFDEAAAEIKPGRVVLKYGTLAAAPEDIRVRVLMQGLVMLRGRQGYGPRLENVEALAIRLFADPRFKKASLGGCLVGVDRKKALLVIEKERVRPR